MPTRTLPNTRGLFVFLLLAALIMSLGLTPRGHSWVTLNPGELPSANTVLGATDLSSLPLAAQAVISAVLGRDHPSYEAVTLGNGFYVENPKHALVADFTPDGVQVRTSGAIWELTFSGYGYGEAIGTGAAVAPQANANRVEYRRGALTEWYVNGPLGLEQGFTLESTPGDRQGGPLTIALNLSGDLAASMDPGGDGLILSQVDGTTALRYRGLGAQDATSRELPAWLQVQGAQLLLRVDDAGAQYPLVVDPFVQQAKLTASDGAFFDQFGGSVALSGDTVVVGARFHDVVANANQGSAYVFVKPAGGWSGSLSENAKLTASDGAKFDHFGGSVALSGDTMVVGADFGNSGTNNDQGSAYVFVFVPNQAPTVTVSGGQCNSDTSAAATLNLTVGDEDVGSLTVSATSGNQDLLPDGNLVLGGSGANRTLSLTVAPMQSGTAVITVSVSDETDETDSAITVKVGTPQNDTLNGTDTLKGLAGNDLLCGGNGNDTLNGGAGEDHLYGGRDNDVLNGGNGNDRLYGEKNNDQLTGGPDADFFSGGDGGNDTAMDFMTSQGDTQDGTIP